MNNYLIETVLSILIVICISCKKEGEYIEYYNDCTVKKNMFYKDGQLDGIVHQYDSRGLLMLEEIYKKGDLISDKVFIKEKLKAINYYKNGEMNGEGKFFYNSGHLLSIVFWKEGIEEGPEIHYYENDTIYSKGQNKNGAKTGLWKYYNELGILIKVEEYYKGLKSGVWEYYNNKKLIRKETFRDGALHSIDSLK